MSGNKRYYWLKLNENFFEDDTISWIEEQENGKDYIIFYLKLALKSLQDDGRLIRYVGETLMPYDAKALSRLTNTNIDTVNTAMMAFESIGLIERLDTGEIYMNQINELVGSETDSAKRVRKHRAIKNAKQQHLEGALQSNTEVTKCNTEIEIEKEKELEIDKELDSPAKAEPPIPYKEIIEYLNKATNSNYRHYTKSTRHKIKARFNEGFGVDDFKKVIDVKAEEWLNDNKMSQYLRPETLFGTKFESYLNQPLKRKQEYKYGSGTEPKEIMNEKELARIKAKMEEYNVGNQ